MMQDDYLIVGLTGSIGAGKSVVAQFFRDSGIPVLSADAIAKELMADDPTLRSGIIALLGEESYGSEGLDRRYIADRVFGDEELLAALNALVHPHTIAEQGRRAAELIGDGAQIVVCEAALIYETDGEGRFDYVVVVDAPEKVRYERAAARDGSSVEEIERRDRMQYPAAEKVRRADFVIRNDGDLDALRRNSELVITLLRALPPRHHVDLLDEQDAEQNRNGADE